MLAFLSFFPFTVIHIKAIQDSLQPKCFLFAITVYQLCLFLTEQSFHFHAIYILSGVFLLLVSMVMKKKLCLVFRVCRFLSLMSTPPASLVPSISLSLSLLQVYLISHLPACFPPSPLPIPSRRWRPAPCPATTCPLTSWWWWGMAASGRAPSPSSFSRRSLCQTTTPPSKTRTSNTLRLTDSGPYWMVSRQSLQSLAFEYQQKQVILLQHL